MALQVDSQDQITEFIGVLSRRRWQIIVPALYVIMLGVVVGVFIPKKYVAEMQINLLEARIDDRDNANRSLEQTATQREIENAEYQAKSSDRVRRVIDELNWSDYLQLDSVERNEYLARVKNSIEVAVLPKTGDEGSTFIDLSYADVDSGRAIAFLSRLSTLWVQEVYDRDTKNLRLEKETLQNLRDDARKELETLERRRGQLIIEAELSPTQLEGGNSGGREEDPLFKRMNARRDEIEDLTIAISEFNAKIDSLQKEYDAEPAYVVQVASLQGKFDQQIAAIERQMSELVSQQDRYLPANTQWQKIQDQVADLEGDVELIRQQARETVIQSEPVPNPRRKLLSDQMATLRSEADAKGRRLAELSALDTRDEQAYETRVQAVSEVRDIDTKIILAKARLVEAEDQLSGRNTKLELLQKAYPQPWIVTEEAHTDKRPTQPNVAIIVIFVSIMGIGLGLTLAVVREFTQPGFRNPGDAARAIELPVLGVVGEFKPQRERRRESVRRIVVGLSTLVILGGVGWFTWTWANRPELLSTEVLEVIEGVRMELR
ncbi:hypothetical protein [Engelhardtia mirabilis]|uniref:Uncharacterized protein n=1 Tax=Engelhardtia mirabilis TaxID=2528011 RepID=A0A518BKC3_9BACT|nr:hypothetical protein Pla133_25100 [Planctomycetes bacterium Pla133]QDV01753.1 hypothetical protein Pla86_25090 [Planctomycetes bacterium Pla86]